MEKNKQLKQLIIQAVQNVSYIADKNGYQMQLKWKSTKDNPNNYSSIIFVPQSVFYSVSLFTLKIQENIPQQAYFKEKSNKIFLNQNVDHMKHIQEQKSKQILSQKTKPIQILSLQTQKEIQNDEVKLQNEQVLNPNQRAKQKVLNDVANFKQYFQSFGSKDNNNKKNISQQFLDYDMEYRIMDFYNQHKKKRNKRVILIQKSSQHSNTKRIKTK